MVLKKRCGEYILRIALRITILVFLLAGVADAATITVNASGGGDYTRIQDAIDYASAGDEILVYSSTYLEKVNITKQLILRGIGNPVVDAGGRKSAITLCANGITLEGFTVILSSGAGINVTSSNNTISENNALYNYYGISLYSSSNNTMSKNNAFNNGYNGISLFSSSNNMMSRNNASNNRGFGIYLSQSYNNSMVGNNASNNEIGILLWDSSNNTPGGNNVSNNNNGIFLWYSRNNTMVGNNASNNDIGISLSDSRNNTLSGNNVSNNNYGIYHYGSRNNKIYNNIFNNIFKNINTFESSYESNINLNTWNTKKQSGTNIIGGPILGGNFWANPDGTGFSQTCEDMNSNGICEKRYILNENNTDYLPLSMNFTKDNIPPKSVSKLKNITYAKNYINWTWKDPKDIDFKKVMVFIDNKFKRNVSKGKRYYNATNFKANTMHTISTWTVDMNGNINKTWTNRSAGTAK